MNTSRSVSDRLSPKGQEIAQAFERQWSQTAAGSVTLPTLMQRWEEFSKQVNVGFPGYFEEYLNEVTVRDLLDEVVKALPPIDAAIVQDGIAAGDQSYVKATRPDDRGEMSKMYRISPDAGWWWRRFPTKLPVDPSR